MSNLHKRAMEAVLQAAEQDILATIEEREIEERHGEDAEQVALDVAILHAYRIFIRICEQEGLNVDAALFAELASELAEEVLQDGD